MSIHESKVLEFRLFTQGRMDRALESGRSMTSTGEICPFVRPKPIEQKVATGPPLPSRQQKTAAQAVADLKSDWPNLATVLSILYVPALEDRSETDYRFWAMRLKSLSGFVGSRMSANGFVDVSRADAAGVASAAKKLGPDGVRAQVMMSARKVKHFREYITVGAELHLREAWQSREALLLSDEWLYYDEIFHYVYLAVEPQIDAKVSGRSSRTNS